MELWPERRRKQRKQGSGFKGWGPWSDEAAPGEDADVRRAGAEGAGGPSCLLPTETAATPSVAGRGRAPSRTGSCRFTLLIPNVTDRGPRRLDFGLRTGAARAGRRKFPSKVSWPARMPSSRLEQAVQAQGLRRDPDLDAAPANVQMAPARPPASCWATGVPVTVVTPVKSRLPRLPGALEPRGIASLDLSRPAHTFGVDASTFTLQYDQL